MSRAKYRSAEMDLTQGPIGRQLLTLGIPIALGQLVQSLYTMADSAVVGRAVGDMALAAVGCSTQVINFLMFVFTGVGTGAGVMVSQYFGAKDKEKLSRAIHGSILLAVLVGLGTALVGILLSRPFLRLLNTPDDGTLHMAVIYMCVMVAGAPATALYNITGGILRSVGDSKSPFYFLLIASVLNILLDLLFVAVFHWGVAGAAVATILSQGLSAVLAIIKLCRTEGDYRLELKKIRWYREECVRVLKVGLPLGMQMGFLSVGMLVIQGMINSFGSTVMAGFTIAMRFDHFFILPIIALQQAHIIHVGQNIGARNLQRVDESVKVGCIAGVVYCLLLIPFIHLCGEFCLGLFTESREVVHEGMRMLKVMAPFYWLSPLHNVYSNTYRGAGYSMQAFAISVCTCFFGRIVVGLLLMHLTGEVTGLYYGIAADFVLATVFGYLYGMHGSWRKKVMEQNV